MSARWYLVSALSCFALCPCFGTEAVYFKTGFSLEVDSHTRQDQTLIVQVRGGMLQFPIDQVLRIEVVPDLTVAQPSPSSPAPGRTTKDVLTQAASSQGLDLELIQSVAKIESGLRENAVSPKGAVGLMQLMPGTAAGLGVNPTVPAANAEGGAKYLRDLLIRYNGNSALALAAYNAGPGAVAKFGGVPPYAETRQYVLKVIREYQREKQAKQITSPASTNSNLSKPTSTN